MNKNIAIGIVVALVVIGGGYYLWQAGMLSPAATPVAQAWKITETAPDQDGTPRAEVSLNGRVVGTYEGNCSEIKNSSWELLAGEQSGVICWWAGGGKEIGLFANEDGGYEVMVGDLDEGSAEAAGVRGNFVIQFSL